MVRIIFGKVYLVMLKLKRNHNKHWRRKECLPGRNVSQYVNGNLVFCQIAN